jgi:hypothetical protein
MTEDELTVLEWLFSPYNTVGAVGVEVGSCHGRSSYTIAKSIPLGSLFCIDTWRGNPTHEEGVKHNVPGKHYYNTLEFFKENIQECHNITPVRGVSPLAVRTWSSPVDFFFLDAAHSNPGCQINIDFWLPKMKSGGVFAGHDLYDCFPDIISNVKLLEGRLNQKVMTFPGASIWAFKII